jgi:hypothetical protein
MSSLGFRRDAPSSPTSHIDDPHAVSFAEAQGFYAGLPSDPVLIYRSEKEEWSPPSVPEAYRRKKQLRPVFNHPIVNVWNNDLGWKVVAVLDARAASQCVSVISSSLLTVPRSDLRASTLYALSQSRLMKKTPKKHPPALSPSGSGSSPTGPLLRLPTKRPRRS